MRVTFAAIAAITGAIAAAGYAYAQTVTGQFTVRAEVQAICELTTTDLDFGVYTAASRKDADTTFVIDCSPGTPVWISLSAGGSGNPVNRYMASGADHLTYQLYTDAARTQPINTTNPVYWLYHFEISPKTMTVYGRIPSDQSDPPGIYEDVIVITAVF